MQALLPYENNGESISVNLDFPGIEKTEIGTYAFLLDRSKLTGPIPILVEAQLPDTIDDAFPPSDRQNPPMAVIATVKSVDGLLRTQMPLKLSKKSLYAGTVTLDPAVISESASLCVYAVRSAHGRSTAGYAKQKGSRLAWSPVHEIRMVDRPLPKGKFLRIVWDDFEKSTVVPSGFRGAFHYVHTESSEPVLYLNKQAKPPLVKLLETKGHGHSKALPRDVLFSSIAVPVWTSLVYAALEALRREGDETDWPVDFKDAFDGTWRGEVLKWISARVLPEMLPEDALFEFCSKMGQNDFYTDVLARAQVAIQSEEKLLDRCEQFALGVFENG
jgi:hypothetical protein